MDVSAFKLLRLTRGRRYVVAVQTVGGEIEPHAYWDEAQALAAKKVPSEFWLDVDTEIYTEVPNVNLPAGNAMFSRQRRGGPCLGVVLWRGSTIYPFIFPSEADALAAVHVDHEYG
ncbi:hypothetical protein JNB91_18460 [Rhizobium wenxiniae]|uniref:hypothetical protein n=1 Tax=Rhizobium wenxiniae TaxID=1737357 RepID=UPI001C6DF4AF|nr:hypothetical protein [Rhizobium wenxiniae]MBW9089802.1 hypothetical protein [Rhizobium wenxiniae]